jgi:Asp/Glu/hydantoin racemase
MTTIALVNPNTSAATLERMLAAARPLLPPGFALLGAAAERGASMILDEAALAVSADEVVRIGTALAPGCEGIVVAAFGDPGVERLRRLVDVPVLGIGEAAMRAASERGRFGVATTTPLLAAAIERLAAAIAAPGQFGGVRLADGDPLALAADPALQTERLFEAVQRSLEHDRVDAVVIGGGPLSDSARALRERYGECVVEPVPAAMQRMIETIRGRSTLPVGRARALQW